MISQPIAPTPLGLAQASAGVRPEGALGAALIGLTRLAARVCGSPLASITVHGVGEAWCSPSAEISPSAAPSSNPFAPYAAQTAQLFEIPDVAQDDRFRSPLQIPGLHGIRSYAGYALRGTGGCALGTIAVYDTAARSLTPEQRSSLQLLAEQAVNSIELHARLTELALFVDAPPQESPRRIESTLAGALIESAPVAVYHTDAAGNLIYSNPEYRRIFGLQLGHSADAWAQLVHPDDRDWMETAWAEFCSKPIPSRFAYRTRSQDGTVRHFAEQVVAVGGVAGWIGTIADFSDLVAARDNLRKAETLFRNTFDQAPLGIVYSDRDGKLLRYNQAFCAMLGFDAEQMGDMAMRNITSPEDEGRVSTEREKLWNGEIQMVDLEKRLIRKDGSILWARTTTALVRETDAAAEFSVEFFRDITARKETDQELERVHKQLMTASRQAGMAEVATNVLHNVGNILNSVNISASLVIERVKQSKGPGVSRLATLLQEKGAAVADFIAHDERGKRIPEYLTSLGEQLVSDQKVALEELASLRENLEHIKDTVAMQQNYAKLCGVTETVAVAELVEDSLRLNAGAFVRHGVTLCREFGEVPPITVDKHKVLQILVNLVRNAKYACDESGRTDKLLTLRIEKAQAGVRICVIDNGVGIPAENMARLFTHGFTTRASGHGFGLHSGALAAQELGGSLRVESDGPGCGATFILELPCDSGKISRG